ncbi:DUF6979 family protein [Winogradskyella thalassocola]|uniref:Uncharacterized protein n=1 Tax=Winogradskyella thalassocola TaxID=262004 RepID=A0A1G7ZNA4_9FLAO|nr:hypothetical protein [Winogradskyella thalassocola]SDH10241.1 hypothetical protein SAMN04489796_1011389 [Winogradskyella thalassocola]
MNKYGQAVLKAVKNYKDSSPITEIYARAAKEIFFDSISSQEKGCPKATFLGLCEAGLVKGIPKGKYTKSVKNKKYAIDAIKILKQADTKTFTSKELWAELNLGDKKTNSQMDVVLVLWNEGLIVK